MSRAFRAVAIAILKGFVRDRASVFFAIVFPLMFLVLFGGIFNDSDASRSELVEIGRVGMIADLPPDARDAFDQTFKVTHAEDRAAALAKVRKGDADVAVEMQGKTLVAHYTQTDQVQAAITQGTLRAFVDGANVAASGRPPVFDFRAERVEDSSLQVIQYVTPGLLGWAVAMSAAFGAAATLQGWRQSKLLRRLQLSPAPTRTIVSARVVVTIGIALVQMAIFLGLGWAAFGLELTGWWCAGIPLLVAGTLCFMSSGLFAGAVAHTTEGAVNMANFLVLPMAFLSGSFFPLEAAPPWLQTVSLAMPLRHLNDGMLDVLVRGEGPSAVLVPMAILMAFAVVMTAVAVGCSGGTGPDRRTPTPASLRCMPLLTTPKALLRRHLVAPVARLAGAPLRSPLAGRVVLVTGASSGIGEATAKAVAERGGEVLLVARRQEELDRVVEEVRAAGGSAYGYPCDLTDAEQTDALVRRVLSEHDHVDMVVNNAGRSIRRSLELSYDRMHDFERTMAINFFGPVRLTLGLLPRMRERRFGHVVNIVTWGVQIKAPKFAAYISSKTALDTFSRIAGRETFFDNVTFTNLRLDLVRTDMIEATDAYAKAPAKSPERAALLVVRALEDRPLTISTAAGRVGEVLNLLAPRAMDAAMALMNARMPDSPAARAHVTRSETEGTSQTG